MKVLVTGTHLTPALAIIEELKKNYHSEIVYVGRKTTLEGDETPSVESQILPKLGVKFIPLIAGRLQRTLTIYTIPSLLKIPIGFLQALFIILAEKPDVILSFGGYVAVPSVFVGWLFSIPIIIHEQTLVSGLANKISSFFADKIAISFERTLKEKEVLTGNPIRKEIIAVKPARHKGINILITGGNQGSHVINLAVEQSLNKLTKLAHIIHVTGDNRFHDFERLAKFTSESYMVKKWIGEEWGSILKKVNLVVSRAGINTLTELAYLGIPALVIPVPYLYQDEQNKNAKYFEKLGLVKILPQSSLSADTLFKNVKIMLDDLNHLTAKAKLARRVVSSDAAKRLALETVLLKEW